MFYKIVIFKAENLGEEGTLKERINCPNCNEELNLSEEERKYKIFGCPECKKMISAS